LEWCIRAKGGDNGTGGTGATLCRGGNCEAPLYKRLWTLHTYTGLAIL
jgi:hypothetical protein